MEEVTHTEKPSQDAPIELEVGNHSKRIYKIRVDMVKLGCEGKHVRLQIEPLARSVVEAMKQFSTTVPLKLRDRYEMPENLVLNNRNEIFSAIAG